MNFYVDVINRAVGYIEDNIGEKLPLSVLSHQFGLSDFHFNRMFKTVTGITLKQYILGRKLTRAMGLLRNTNLPVIDIALDLGFEYPEVFSRAFKSQYGVSPAHYRSASTVCEGTPKASIVERDIINYRGVLALKGSSTLTDEFWLAGVSVDVNVYSDDFRTRLQSASDDFIVKTKDAVSGTDPFFTVVNCHGEENGEYTVFFGWKADGLSDLSLDRRVIPAGWYVKFQYTGDMFDIRESFSDDLYRWIMVKEAEIEANGIGMLNIVSRDCATSKSVSILIPVKRPV